MRQYAQNWEIDCQGMTSVYKNPYLTKISELDNKFKS